MRKGIIHFRSDTAANIEMSVELTESPDRIGLMLHRTPDYDRYDMECTKNEDGSWDILGKSETGVKAGGCMARLFSDCYMGEWDEGGHHYWFQIILDPIA